MDISQSKTGNGATATPRRLVRPGDRLDLVLTVLLLTFIVIVAMGAVWVAMRSNTVLTDEVRSELETRASLAAMQFSANEIAAIRGPQDENTPLFRMLVERAERIREKVPTLRYVYIMRETGDPSKLSFVIENDMLYTPAQQDINGDGVIEINEQISKPGDLYDIANIPALNRAAFEGPTSDAELTYDQWGAWISGYAPIRDATGKTVAILGIDVGADQFLTMTKGVLSPEVLIFAMLGIIFVAGGFLVFFWRRRLRLLRRIDAQRSAMVTVASHKLGGPIATIRWWVEALADGSFDGKQRAEAQQELSNAVERLSDVTRHLEDATRVDGTDPGLWKKLAQETGNDINGGA